MRHSLDYVDPRTKFEKTYRGAGLTFGLLVGLNSVLLLVIANFSDDVYGTYAGERMFMNGFGVALAGFTVGITIALFNKQRWAAYLAFIITALLLVAAVLAQVVDIFPGGDGPSGGGVIGIVLVALATIVQFNAVRIPRPYQLAPSPRRLAEGYPLLQPYSATPAGDRSAAPPGMPVKYPLGNSGIAMLAVCGLTVLAGIGMSVYGIALVLNPEVAEWVVVRDEVIGVQLEMPGQPQDVLETPDLTMSYIRTQEYAAEFCTVSITCVELHEGFGFREQDVARSLTTGVDYSKATVLSRERIQSNGIEMHALILHRVDGWHEYKWVFHTTSHCVTVIVTKPQGRDFPSVDRVLESIRYTVQPPD